MHSPTKENPPLISIIIVVFNGEKYIEQSITSVINQDYKNIELIIIDGASKDNTLQIIGKYKNRISKIISEPDSGIYNAMNKGLSLCSGDWIYFLGSDDKFISKNIISTIFKQDFVSNTAIVFGNVKNQDGKRIYSKFNWKILLHNSLHHQSVFYRKEIFKDFKYNENFKIISDYELNLILFLKKIKYVKLDIDIAVCQDGGASTTAENFKLFINETNTIRNIYFKGYLNIFFKALFDIKCRIHHAIRHI